MASKRPVIAARLDQQTADALEVFARENTGGNASEAVRLLLQERLRSRSGLAGLSDDLEQDGYDAGVRRGLYESREAIKAAVARLWRGKG